MRGLLCVVVLWCSLTSCLADEEEPSGDTLCNLHVCECREHNSSVAYNKSKGGPLDIFCSCENTNWRVMHLLSPHPVPRHTVLLHVTACEEVSVTPIDVGQQLWGWPDGLIITDVPRLSVEKGGALSANHVLVKNVGLVPELPLGVLRSFTFPDRPITTFQLQNVTVDVIKEGAFSNVHVTHLFQLRNVTVGKIEEHAFNVTVQQGEFIGEDKRTGATDYGRVQLYLSSHSSCAAYQFLQYIGRPILSDFLLKTRTFFVINCYLGFSNLRVVDSTIRWLESQGLTVSSGYVTLERSSLGVIEPHGLRVIAEHFMLANCSVHGPVRSLAFDVQACFVGFVHNELQHLDTMAFFGVRKLEFFLNHPGRKWQFAFAGNYIRSAHRGSLNPSWPLDVRSDVVHANVFEDCSCEAISWLHNATHHDQVPEVTRHYYKTLLDSESICDIDECPLSVKQAVEFYRDVKVAENASQLCEVGVTYIEICENIHGGASSVKICFASIFSVITMLLISLSF